MDRKFIKDQKIIHNDTNYKCICADKEVAVFGKFLIQYDKQGDTFSRVDYETVFVVSNNLSDDSFEFEYIDVL